MNLNPLTWGDNEKALVRLVRYAVLGGVAAAIGILIQQLPGIDLPGEWDVVLSPLILAGLAAAEKAVRNLQ